MAFLLRFFEYQRESGQALLIVILVMVVGLAVALAVASRSLTNLRNSTEEQNSQKAFSNAEAGIERLLKSQVGTANGPGGDVQYNAQIAPISGTAFLLDGGNLIKQDDGATVWFVPHKADGTVDFSTPWNGNITLYWGDTNDCNSVAAVEFIVVSGTSTNTATTSHYAYDPCASSRSNHFAGASSVNTSIQGKNLKNASVAITISNGLVGRAIPLYKSSIIGVTSTANLPSQGKKITSVGTYGATADQKATRKIVVYQGYPELFNEFFQYNLLVPK